MIKFLIKFFFLFLLVFINTRCGTRDGADIIIIAPVYTMDDQRPWAEAVAIKSNKIIYVGDKITAKSFLVKSTQIVERPDGMVLPGFVDSHVHLIWGGIEMSECHLHNLQTEEQIYNAIKDYIKKKPEYRMGSREWLVITGIS